MPAKVAALKRDQTCGDLSGASVGGVRSVRLGPRQASRRERHRKRSDEQTEDCIAVYRDGERAKRGEIRLDVALQ